MTFSDYRRWCSRELFEKALNDQLEQWWPKGQTFAASLQNFGTSKARLLPNMADQFCWTPMEASVWTSGIQTLPFLNCNFGIQNVPQELSNFVVWFGLDTVPRTYFDQMYRALLNGQAGEIHPAHLNFTHGERNFQFSPRSALLFFACQFSISRVQQADVNFDLLKSHVTFTSQMAVSGTDGTLTTLCILDQRLFS
jgi:hypothetical protein